MQREWRRERVVDRNEGEVERESEFLSLYFEKIDGHEDIEVDREEREGNAESEREKERGREIGWRNQ